MWPSTRMAQHGTIPGVRRPIDAEEARHVECERIHKEVLDQFMRGEGETSYPMEIITDDKQESGLWHQLMAACETSLTDEAEAGRQLKAIYKAGCERYAERRAEDV